MDTQQIQQLYDNVLCSDLFFYRISENEVISAIESMRDVYHPEMSELTAPRSFVADYNDPAHRCAYLHKYAAFHTAMVRDFFHHVIYSNYRLFYHQLFSMPAYSICSLGGGPGNDVIAILSTLHHVYSYFPASATVIDYMVCWQETFKTIIQELSTGNYGDFGGNTSHYLNWRYCEANLLRTTLDPEVADSICSASLVTMIKFVSATSCKNTQSMIDNIFYHMKPGAVLFYIDNDGGGYHQLIQSAAVKFRFETIFGPLKHEEYLNGNFKNRRFGIVSCHRTVVTVHALIKPLQHWVHSPFPQLCAESPLTPFIHVAGSHQDPSDDCPDVSPLFTSFNKENQEQPPSLLGTPQCGRVVNTPSQSPVVSKRIVKAGCLPVHRWRHHVAKRLNNVKYRAKKFFKTKKLRF